MTQPGERALAWLVTGPVGHLVGGLIDWLAALATACRASARGRIRW